MKDERNAAISSDPRSWRPQIIHRGRSVPEVVNPIIEPLWAGTRVLAYYRESEREDEWGWVELRDADGADVSDLAPPVVDMLRRSINTREAVIDGVITSQATAGGEGTAIVVFGKTSPVKRLFLGGRQADVDFDGPRVKRPEGEPAFVGFDLLSLDDETLFDVPLLERKRLLDSIVEQSDLVRLSPWVRPPLRTWFSSWRAAGFRGAVMKSANSRYAPGEETIEWVVVEHMPRS